MSDLIFQKYLHNLFPDTDHSIGDVLTFHLDDDIYNIKRTSNGYKTYNNDLTYINDTEILDRDDFENFEEENIAWLNELHVSKIIYNGKIVWESKQKFEKAAKTIQNKWRKYIFKSKVKTGLKKIRSHGMINYAPPGQFHPSFPGGKEYHKASKSFTKQLTNDMRYLKTLS